jgi:hypothetical protein
MKSLEAAARDFTTYLKRDFAEEIAHRPRDFKKQVFLLIRHQLPLRQGRPTSPQIEAVAMLREGKTVRQILHEQVRGFDQLDTYGRYLAEKALRQAVPAAGEIRNSRSNTTRTDQWQVARSVKSTAALTRPRTPKSSGECSVASGEANTNSGE